MNNRLELALNQVKHDRKKIFCGYITLGFPSITVTRAAMLALERAGTDIIELGFPFSDPLADGPTIQRASEQALKSRVTIEDACSLVSGLRKKGFKTPVIFFSYLNPIMQFGVKIGARLKSAGFDGVIIPDLTYDEGKCWEKLFQKAGLSLIYLVAPTTVPERMRRIARHSRGFVYYVSLRGVTGVRDLLARDLKGNLKALKRVTQKPVLVGFGVSRPSQARTISRFSDGVIVGSALVRLLKGKNGPAKRISSFSSGLIKAMR